MRFYIMFALLLALVVPAKADKSATGKSPQAKDVVMAYKGLAYLDHKTEIGKATLMIAVDCQPGDEAAKDDAAKKAIATEVTAVEGVIVALADKLKLGKPDDFWGYDLKSEMSTGGPEDPVSQVFDETINKYVWKDRCTGKQSLTPFRVKGVYSAQKLISVWFPNKGEVLNQLPVLIDTLEARSDKSPAGVKITNNSATGAKFDPGLTKPTSEAMWQEIEKTAEERAEERMKADFEAFNYDTYFEGPRGFKKNEETNIPVPQEPVKEGGKWVAKFSDVRPFLVFAQQLSDPESRVKGVMTLQKRYSVPVEAKTDRGIYGTLNITITQDCVTGDKADKEAEKRVSAVAAPIIQELRRINNKQTTETDKLKLENAVGGMRNPLVGYTQIGPDKKEITYFYNPCTLQVHEVTVKPKVQVGQATQNLVIVSSNLDDLTKLRDDLAKKYTREINDPNEIKVTANWSATVILSERASMAARLEAEAVKKFLGRTSPYRCDPTKFGFACLSQQGAIPFGHDEALAPSPAAKEEAFAEEAGAKSLVIEEAERDDVRLIGTYTINYTVRKVLLPLQEEAED